jgi:hypothetical protein
MRFQGEVDSQSRWVFVTKFCYAEGVGNLTYSLNSSHPNSTVLALYNDEENTNFADVYHKKMSCQDKLSHAVINLGVTNGKLETIQPAQYARPRWWYAVAADCSDSSDLDLTFNLHFLNPGNEMNREFSFDEQGLLIMYLIYFIFYCVGLTLHAYGLYMLFNSKSLHPIVFLLTGTIILELLTFFCFLIHFGSFASDGIGYPDMQDFGELLDMVAMIMFMVLLVLLSKGWGVSGLPLTHGLALVAGSTVFLILYFALFLWQQFGVDPASTVYYYDTVPGYLIITLRIFVLVYFSYNIYESWRAENHPIKRRFYFALGSVYAVWFLVLPFIVLVALGISPWVRQRAVMATYYTLNTIAFGILAYLLWPTNASAYFKIAPPEIGETREAASGNAYETL